MTTDKTPIISPIKTSERTALLIKAGDTVRVWQKIKEAAGKDGKEKFRLQAFDGIVLSHKHGTEAGATFTVRKVIDGVGVEKIFPLFSPMIDKIELVRRSKVRRSKLYYVREKAAKEIRRNLRKLLTVKDAPIQEDTVVEADGGTDTSAVGTEDKSKVEATA